MTPDELGNIATELKRFGTELSLSGSQKGQFRTFLTEKYGHLQEYKKQNPNVSKEDIVQYVAKIEKTGEQPKNVGCRGGKGKGLSKSASRQSLIMEAIKPVLKK